MINKKFGKDLVLVVLSNLVRLLSSVLTVFFIPLIFSQQDYGFYKLFLLYVSYVGIFHFGFIDGIYLHYAGLEYEKANKYDFRLYTKILGMIESILAIIIIIFSFFISGERQIIVSFVGVNLLLLNLTSYYQFLSQVMQRFKEFAIRNIMYTIMNVTLILIFYFFSIENYLLFIFFTLLINLTLLASYIFTYREITFGENSKYSDNKTFITYLFKIGFILLLSNIVVLFFSSIPIQFVDFKFPVEIFPDIFSNFSFAYTLMGFVGVFMSAISLVLYPTLKKSSEENMKSNYNWLISIVLVTVFAMLSAYFPLSYIINRFLPNYIFSLSIFYILAPGIAFTSAVSVVMHNYYKTLNINKQFLLIGVLNLIVLALSIYFVNTFINQDVIYIAIVTVIIQFIWYICLDLFINIKYKNVSIRNLVFIFLSSMSFYSIARMNNLVFGFIFYILSVIIISTFVYFPYVSKLILQLKHYKSKR